MTRKCPTCGAEFEPACNRQRYCSSKCRKLITRGRVLALRCKPKVCAWCGEEFIPSHGRQKFCSPACATRSKNRKWREAHRKPCVPRTCPICGAEFEPSDERQRYCSKRCKKRQRSRRNNERIKAARAAARGVVKCAWCGEEFTPKNIRARFCSKRCWDAAYYACRTRQGACRRRRHVSGPNITFAKQAGPRPEEESIARVRAYLSLPPAERWARRGELTADEHKLAQKIYMENHSIRTVATNDLMH